MGLSLLFVLHNYEKRLLQVCFFSPVRNVSIAALKHDAEFYGIQPLGKV